MENFVPLEKRPEWSDVTPLYIDEATETPVCRICYTDEFRSILAYFNAVLASGEMSQRALALTSEVIQCNPANYTSWYYRRCIINKLYPEDIPDEVLEGEEKLMKVIGEDSYKNYQLWHHRQWISMAYKAKYEKEHSSLIGYEKDHEYIKMALDEDNKNYHAWSHRVWLLETFGPICEARRKAAAASNAAESVPNFMENEAAFSEEYIKKDPRNNSAFSYRYAVMTKLGWTEQRADDEARFCLGYIKKMPNNEATWNYLKGVLRAVPRVSEWVCGVLEGCVGCWPACPHLPAFLGGAAAARGDGAAAARWYTALRDRLDTTRKRFWQYKIDSLTKQ